MGIFYMQYFSTETHFPRTYEERLQNNRTDFFAKSLWPWQQQPGWHISVSSHLHQLYHFQGHMANTAVAAFL
jgi:hypothetical protein